MNVEPIPIIELNQTDPKQRGQAYGEAARERIETIAAAYREIFQTTTGSHSINYFIGLADGEAVDLETSPVEENVLWPRNGICVHTNHYLEPGKNFRDIAPLKYPYPTTYLRFRRAQKRMRESAGDIDADVIQDVLKDHMDKPFSVCTHSNPAVEPLLQIVTNLSIVMNLSQKQIRYTAGNPCRGVAQTLNLDW
jgi:isopenicillin-N N-acyltransferase-like protein